MLDHDSTHRRELLVSSEMPAFFADLTAQYQGKPITLHSDSQPEYATGGAPPAVLTELSFARKHRKDTLTVHTVQAGEPSETTVIANLVWVVRDEDHNLIALEVRDEHDRTLVLGFGD
jgi:hypothetical protein